MLSLIVSFLCGCVLGGGFVADGRGGRVCEDDQEGVRAACVVCCPLTLLSCMVVLGLQFLLSMRSPFLRARKRKKTGA